jgi:tetratricopeptide (TPR) repeat protein
MSVKFKMSITFILLALFINSGTAKAQLLRDSTTLRLVKTDIDCIYNQQFNDAQTIYLKIQKSYPGHPVLYLLRGLQTYWKNYPLLATTPARASFEKDLRQCILLSKKNKNPQYEAEYLLYCLCAKGMLLKFYDENDLTIDAIPLASSTYDYLGRSFQLSKYCTDLYYFTGVYNYYREAYPDAYPVYKPLVFLFRNGNMKTGLKELQNASANAIVLRAESYLVLTLIYLNFENNYAQAIKYSKSIHEIYPDNMLYLATYIKNMLLVKQYNEAEKHIEAALKVVGNKYFQAQLFIFKGILQEKKYHDNTSAAQYYNKGISNIASFGDYGNEYAAYAYLGLSRISYIKKEMDAAKQFRAKAMKVVVFKNITFDK